MNMEINKNCKIFAKTIEETATQQIYDMAKHPLFESTKIRIMPDCHAGKGCTIGTSYPITTFVNPSNVGVDIGCGIETYITDAKVNKDEFALIEHRIKKEIPFGFAINNSTQFEEKEFYKFMKNGYNKAISQWGDMVDPFVDLSEEGIKDICDRIGMDLKTFYKSISSVGSGNHFLELGETPQGTYAFTIHCGSRNFGVKVCKYWENIAKNQQYDRAEYRENVKKIKKTCKNKNDIPKLIAEMQKEMESKCAPQGYLMGNNLRGYISDMVVAQLYAEYNRMIIARKIANILLKINGGKVIDVIKSVHNYIDLNDHILRKGAIKAYSDSLMVIPFNMRDGLAICKGKSNEDWNFTAPHGAGRIMSRAAAKKNLSVDKFKEEMKNVYSTTVCKSTIDESPMAYKDMNEIIELIEPTCEILYFIKPVINIKSTDEIND